MRILHHAVLLSGLCLAVGQNAYALSSEANVLNAELTVDGKAVHIGPIANIGGHVPPKTYNNSISVSGYENTLTLLKSNATSLQFVITAEQLDGKVSGGFGVDTLSSDGKATVGKTDIQLTVAPTKGAVVKPFLHLALTSGDAQTQFDEVVPRPGMFTGSASLEELNISGQLLNDTVVQHSGAVAANTVLFENAQVKVIANQQTAHFPICPLKGKLPTCTPNGLTTHGVTIQLTNAELDGHKVSGSIYLDNATATK